MGVNTFVYPYPVSVFIIQRLGMTVEEFCTVATWAYRNRPVKVLPCDFLYCLSLASGLSMDNVYQDLLLLEEKFLQSLDPKKEKISI